MFTHTKREGCVDPKGAFHVDLDMLFCDRDMLPH